MQEPTRLFDLLQWRKELHPERPVFKFKENGEWKEVAPDDEDEDSNERVKITVTGVAVHVLAANLPDEKIDIISEDLENEELFDDTVASLEDDEDCYKKYLKEIQF